MTACIRQYDLSCRPLRHEEKIQQPKYSSTTTQARMMESRISVRGDPSPSCPSRKNILSVALRAMFLVLMVAAVVEARLDREDQGHQGQLENVTRVECMTNAAPESFTIDVRYFHGFESGSLRVDWIFYCMHCSELCESDAWLGTRQQRRTAITETWRRNICEQLKSVTLPWQIQQVGDILFFNRACKRGSSPDVKG